MEILTQSWGWGGLTKSGTHTACPGIVTVADYSSSNQTNNSSIINYRLLKQSLIANPHLILKNHSSFVDYSADVPTRAHREVKELAQNH